MDLNRLEWIGMDSSQYKQLKQFYLSEYSYYEFHSHTTVWRNLTSWKIKEKIVRISPKFSNMPGICRLHKGLHGKSDRDVAKSS